MDKYDQTLNLLYYHTSSICHQVKSALYFFYFHAIFFDIHVLLHQLKTINTPLRTPLHLAFPVNYSGTKLRELDWLLFIALPALMSHIRSASIWAISQVLKSANTPPSIRKSLGFLTSPYDFPPHVWYFLKCYAIAFNYRLVHPASHLAGSCF